MMKRVRMEGGPVLVPEEVLEGLEAVRLSGLTNMFDRVTVAEIAEAMGFDETAEWVRADRKRYAEGVFRGFAVEDGEPAD